MNAVTLLREAVFPRSRVCFLRQQSRPFLGEIGIHQRGIIEGANPPGHRIAIVRGCNEPAGLGIIPVHAVGAPPAHGDRRPVLQRHRVDLAPRRVPLEPIAHRVAHHVGRRPPRKTGPADNGSIRIGNRIDVPSFLPVPPAVGHDTAAAGIHACRDRGMARSRGREEMVVVRLRIHRSPSPSLPLAGQPG